MKRSLLPIGIGLTLTLVLSMIYASNMLIQLQVTLTPGSDGGTPCISFDPQDPPGCADDDELGQNVLSLPSNSDWNTVDEVGLAMGGWACQNAANPVVNIQAWRTSGTGLDIYDGCFGANFSIDPTTVGHLRVKVNQEINFLITGSHNPAMKYFLTGPNDGGTPGVPQDDADGTNAYARPPNAIVETADALGFELGNFECRGICSISGNICDLRQVPGAQGCAGGETCDAIADTTVVNVQKYVKAGAGLFLYDGCFGAGGGFPLVPGEGYRVKVNTDISFAPQHY